MKRTFTALAALTAVALGATAPAIAADQQLIAAAGLTQAEAEGLTLNQIAAAKYNRDRSYTDRQAVVIVPGASSVDADDLNGLAIANYNAGKSQTDVQATPETGNLTAASRSVAVEGRHAQLIASAGLTQEEAEGLTLNQIVAAKYNRDASYSDRQLVK